MAADYFDLLCQYYNEIPDRKGEVYVPCPSCGKQSKRTNIHFSFSRNGGHCFVCGLNIGLKAMCEQYNLLRDDIKPQKYIPTAPVQEERIYDRRWQSNAWDIVSGYCQKRADHWDNYKPVFKKNQDAYMLGYGQFPAYSSKCEHERLMVPLIVGCTVVGIRGRQVGCQCGKWLSAKGSEPILYNGGQLVKSDTERDQYRLGLSRRKYQPGKTIVIVENPVDAILVEQSTDWIAVATLGVTMWRDEWTTAIKANAPELVVVMYDNDIAGNSTNQELQTRWLTKNPNAKSAPMPNGMRLANTLNAAGIKSVVFRWPKDAKEKADIGDLVASNQMPL